MFKRLLLLPIALVALLLAAAACGGDDDDNTSGANSPTSAANSETAAPAGTNDDSGDDTGDTQNPGGGSGHATLTIGDESWEFDGLYCAFSTEESGNENDPFGVSGFTTTSTGARAQLDASIVDLSGAGSMSPENLDVSLEDIDDFDNPSVSWSTNGIEALGGSTPDLQIDGKNVTINAVFDDNLTESDFETIPGTLVASCP